MLAALIFCGVLFGSGAIAVAAPAPRTELRQALRQVHAGSHAASALARATVPGLWIDGREADAPPYGKDIFTRSGQAVADLVALPTPAGTTAVELILAADRGLAEDTIAEAHGGPAALLATARKALAVGNRQARADELSAAVGSYGDAWQSAFGALAHLVAAKVTRVPSATLATAAEQALDATRFGMAGPRIEQSLPSLTAGGKPEVFYAGSEACPFCGVQRWGMVVALSQFGTFANLHLMQSVESNPARVRTLTFFGSSYRSRYISFVPVEVWSNVPKPPGLAPLQRLTRPEALLVHRFDPAVETPFIDVANRFITDSSTVSPRLIAHKSWTQIAGGLTNPRNVSTQAIAGEAEVLTAEVCEATGGKPQAVCSSAVVQQYEAALPLLNGRGGSCPAPASPGGPPPASDAAARPHHRAARPDPVATAARCQF